VTFVDKIPYVHGLRRVHPSRRLHSLHGWDIMQLLALFKVSNLLDVPWADNTALSRFPLKQLWPSLCDHPAQPKRAHHPSHPHHPPYPTPSSRAKPGFHPCSTAEKEKGGSVESNSNIGSAEWPLHRAGRVKFTPPKEQRVSQRGIPSS
ncbi:MAG: hypothetical protein SGPRY_011401, partial [Prymnesium sp.]